MVEQHAEPRPAFGDFIIYVDESGDHSLTKIDENYPIFSLAFVVVRKTDYACIIVPRLQELKFKWFGHDMAVFHEADIRRRNPPFVFLGNPAKNVEFMSDLAVFLAEAPFRIISAVIEKTKLTRRYSQPENPYALALLFCMERARELLDNEDQAGRVTTIVCESRGDREDKALELEFLRIAAGQHYLLRRPIDGFQLVFADKKCNSTGLQVADLLARPIGLNVLRPLQSNQAFDIVRTKMWDLKRFP